MKKLGIWAIAIAAAFIIGVFSANPVVDAAKAGWQPVVADHEERITDLENQSEEARLYTVTEFHDVPNGTTLTKTLFCNEGDSVINGYFQALEGPMLFNTNSYSIITGTTEGFKISVLNFENTDQNVKYVVVCQKAA